MIVKIKGKKMIYFLLDLDSQNAAYEQKHFSKAYNISFLILAVADQTDLQFSSFTL